MPLGEITIPPHLARRSSAEILAGPKPGWPSAKARTRCSTNGEVWLAMRGRRRSLGRRISGPNRSTWARHR
jgi:hypothetical protein